MSANKVSLEQIWSQSNDELKQFIIGRKLVPNADLRRNRVTVAVFYYTHKYLVDSDMEIVKNLEFNKIALEHDDLDAIKPLLSGVNLDQIWSANIPQINRLLITRKIKLVPDDSTNKINLLKAYNQRGMLNSETAKMLQLASFEQILRSYPYAQAKQILISQLL